MTFSTFSGAAALDASEIAAELAAAAPFFDAAFAEAFSAFSALALTSFLFFLALSSCCPETSRTSF